MVCLFFKKKRNRTASRQVTLMRFLLFTAWFPSVVSLGNNNDNNEAVYLNKLYDSAAGDNWKDNTNWKSKEPVCSWFGVTCEDGSPTDGEGVTQIDMNHNNLNGKIPPEIWKLPKLKQLNLRGNLLTSASFEELRTPTDKAPRSPIETIILSENHITDMKGIGYAGDTLTNLNLNKNQIDEELPIELFQLTNLETLFLAFNNILGTIPTLIGRLSKLSEVYAFNNRFTGQIPSEFGLLDNCQILGLGDNLLTGTLPTELNQMVNMRDLSIHHVQAADGQPKHPGLSGPLLTFGDMPFLTLLFLDGNSFTGTIPSDFLRHNNNLDTPVSVALSYNNITGALPKSLERFESLSIDLVGNRITEIPPELCEKGGWMGGLVEEYKCDAILCGKNSYSLEGRTIADDSTCQPCSDDYPYLGAETCSTDASQQSPWKVLAGFYLAMSGSKWTVRTGWDAFDILFDGGVAADLEAMNIDVCAGFYGVTCNEDGEVTRISLPKNEMFGSIPPTVFTLPKLEVFDLSNNNVEMKDLRSVGRAEGLSSLVLSNVKLDSISGVGDLKLLEQLYLDGLNIQGTLPDELFDLTNLRTLHLQHGSFAGTLPPLIGQLTQLQWLNIYGNSLTGPLPTELGNLPQLHSLDLSENKFVGNLPTELSSLTKLTIFAIHQTEGQLGGPIPAFDTFPSLKELNLESNFFKGQIPDNFLGGVENKDAALSISLGFNLLTGSIPESLDDFDKLTLKLEGNKITGIPSRLCDHVNWMEGEVGQVAKELRCNAILCPPGTWNEYGKETAAGACKECPGNTDLFGQVECGGTNASSREKEILDKLFVETGGRYWNKTHENWQKPGVPICQREGVSCFNADDNEGVRELRMNGFGLRGTIPKEIWELTDARQLAFTNNPVDVNFDGIEKATGLIVLKLSSCHLRTLEGLGNAPQSLKELHLAENQYDGNIPNGVFELDQVVKLFMNNNHFSGRIPSDIGLLTSLTELELWNNRLTGPLPSEIGKMSNLEVLRLSSNEFSGAIPSEIQSLEQLRMLEIAKQAGKKFSGPLPAFDQSPALTTLDASDNSFSGYLPKTFLSQVDTDEKISVDLSLNNFEGSVPEEWSKFESLQLDLSGNMLTSLPNSVCKNNGWNNGLVGLLGSCDAILCPPGTQLPNGRQTVATSPCVPCPSGEESAPFFGTRECIDPKLLLERKILSDFYSASNGTDWLIQSNWLSNYPSCTWYGVLCNEDGFVEELSLENNFLVSDSAATVSLLFTLEHLKVLDLKGNTVALDFQQIPSGSKLEFLRLSGTGLKSIDGVSRATGLKALHATNNELKEIPEKVYSMENLDSLFLSFNSITGTISRKIGALTNLKEFYLFGNYLTGTIPTDVGLLSSLTDFVVAQNFLSGQLPDEFSLLPSLEQLSVYDQEGLELLTGPVPSFSGSPNLWYFDASDNDLTGPLPDNFLINSVFTLDTVSIYLQNNEITGTIPAELSKFDFLDINLAGNKIFEIPEELCNIDGWMGGHAGDIGNCSAILCPKGTFNQFGHQTLGNPCLPCSKLVDVVFLGQTRCENFTSERDTLNLLYDATGGEFWNSSTFWKSDDPICTWGGVLCGDGDLQDTHGITSIILDGNDLSGTLPSDIWTLPSLRSFSVKGNPNLVVTFEGLANAANTLEVLYLSDVTMPSLRGISAATNLKELHITGNDLKGTFPEELLALTDSMEKLFMAYNLFYGPLPTRLGKMSKLEGFYAFGNDFLSTIPSEVGLLKDLKVLVLSENLLYGQIPKELSFMPNLQVFSAFRTEKSGPRLSGSLPSFDKAPQLSDLYLQGNELQGSIPKNFVSASKSIEMIKLSSNLLTGAVPSDLASIPNLFLELDGNQIEEFPSSFCEKNDWMGGAIKTYNCDGFLCPPGTASQIGRAVNASTVCQNCTREGVAPYYGTTSCDGPPNDREILMNLFYALHGDNWIRNDFWGSTSDFCDWYGIGCINGQIVIINLRGNNLKGLPGPDLFYLRELKVLWLYSNPITFSFENIGSARKLQDLNLDATNLHTLHGISAATSLVSFSARFTSVRGQFPEDLLPLSNLRTLSLSGNRLTGTLPASFEPLKFLVSLNLNSNQLTGKLPSFEEMPFLSNVDLSNNKFTGPISRHFLERLSSEIVPTIALSRNQITGVVPQEFYRFGEMNLYVTDNYLLGLPLTLCYNADWNGGAVGDFGCDGIMCKPGTYNEAGRSKKLGTSCRPCASATYYGETVCGVKSAAPRPQRTATTFVFGLLATALFF